ncbi:hypothetical protein DPX16_20181 [Anabarilius grahami]|uniref:Uncharacterized protein n=1 Tax=Anabarilius grahami TaxID=495550 RepID=A0A3N0XE91_ANAGA|nr:hypothetical protein DPX16_20181 [Anabarilius grahami]
MLQNPQPNCPDGRPKDWLGVVRNTLLTRAADHMQHQSQKLLDNDGREVKADDSNQRYDHKDLTEVNFFLAHNLTGLKQEVNNLKLQIAESHKEQLEMGAQDRHNDPGRVESVIEALTQQLDNIKDELRHSCLLQKELQQERHLTPPHGISRITSPSQAPRYKGGSRSLLLDTLSAHFLKSSAAAEGEGLIQMNPEMAHEVTFKDLQQQPPHPLHSSHPEAAQGRLDMPASDL